jgi:hypothetical protein
VLGLARSITDMCNCQVQVTGCSWIGCHQEYLDANEQIGNGYSSALVVAGRRGVVCGGCGLARYCCPQHQQEDWPGHRHVCRRLAAAAAPGAHAGGGAGGPAVKAVAGVSEQAAAAESAQQIGQL